LHNKATEDLDSSDSTSTPQGDGAISPASSGILVEGDQSEVPRSNTLSIAPDDKRIRGFLKKGYVMLAVVLVVVGGFLYWIAASLDPDIGISGLRARTVARSAAHHLSSSPEVISAKVSYAYAASGYGPIAQVKARLKDETSVDQAAELLASTHQKADTSQVPLSATLSWKLNGSDITVNFSCDDSPDNIRAQIRRDLSPVGEAKTITRSEPDGSIKVDYGTVSTVPSSITDPIGPESSQTFTLDGWQVTSTSNKNGQFANTPLEPVITAASQTSTTGTIDLDGGTLSVTGLVADENKGLTLEAAAPVVHAVSDCRIAGLNTLQLNGKVQRGLSSDNDYWLSFTCKDGAWTPQHGGNTGHDEAAILQKAAEL
jgi:hypothetical protein avisC_04409